MAKTLNTRISLRYDTYANWNEKNPTLLAGEIAVVVIPADTKQVSQEPAILFKVGDGTTDFKTLPYACGLAADVYDWAKAAVKPEYTAAEITGLTDYINGEIQDTNTTYTLEQDAADAHVLILKKKEIGETEWTEVTRITTADTKYDDAIAANAGNIATNAGDIAALKALVGETAVATQITNAIEALKLAETYDAKGAAAAALEEAKTYADGKDAAIAEAKGAADAAQAAADAAQGDVDALEGKVGTVEEGKTVVGMISENTAAISKNAEDIAANAAAIEVLNGSGDGSVTKTVTNAINEFAAHMTDDGVVNTYKEALKYIAEHGGEYTALLGTVTNQGEAIEKNAADIQTNAAAISTNGELIAANAEAIEALQAKVGDTDVTAQIGEAIEDALKLEDGSEKYALAADLAATNGNVSKNAEDIAALDASLAAIAKSGNVNDLIQDEGDYLVFNCGGAADSF